MKRKQEPKRQTAVEWLENQLKDLKYSPLEKNGYSNALDKLYAQAKAMDKQQKKEIHKEAEKIVDLMLEMSKRQMTFVPDAIMYSEEEVLAFGKFCIEKIADFLDGKGDQTDGKEYSMEDLFEQFKKK